MPAPFTVSSELIDGSIHKISVEGELDLSTAPRLRKSLRAAMAHDDGSILINLSECEFIDSSGLATIVEAWREQERKSGRGRLALSCASDQVERLLRITGADEVIAVFDDVDGAIASLSSDASHATNG